jgi:hypothetical protein
MNLKTFFKCPITDICLAIQAALVAIAIARAEPEGIILTVFGMAFVAYLRLVDMRMNWTFDMWGKSVDQTERALKMLETCNATLSRYRDLLTMFREGLIIGMASADDETAKSYRAWVEAIDRALKDELKNFKTTVTK